MTPPTPEEYDAMRAILSNEIWGKVWSSRARKLCRDLYDELLDEKLATIDARKDTYGNNY